MTYVHVAIDLTFYFQHVNLLFASEVPSRSAFTDNVHVVACKNIIFTQHIEKPCTKPLQYIHLNEKFGGEKLITCTLCIFKI